MLKSVESKVLVGFISALLLLLAVSGFTYRAGLEYTAASRWVAHTQEVRATMNAMYSALSDAESVQRAYLLTSQPQQRSNYLSYLKVVDTKLNRLSYLTSDNPVQIQNIAALRPLLKQRIDRLDVVMTLFERQGLDAIRKELDNGLGMQLMTDIQLLLGQMESVELELLSKRQAEAEYTRNTTHVLMLLTLLFTLVLLSLLFTSIRREISERKTNERYNDSQRRALLLYTGSYQREYLLHGLLDLLAEQHSFPVSAFYAYEEWSGQLVREAAHGVPSSLPHSFTLDEGLVGVSARSNRPVLLTTPDTALMYIETGIGAFNPAAVLALPVAFNAQCLGVLVLAAGEPLNTGDSAFLEHHATQLGVALNNAKQFGDLKYLSEQLGIKGNEIHQKNLQLEEASRLKSEFLANMSHELRTPLNAIIGFSEALKDGLMGEVAPNQREYLDDIYNSGEHLLSLINDILDLSKVESGKMTLDLEPVAINDLLNNSLSMVKEKALNHRIKLTLDADTALPEIVADHRKLKQIVFNLLSNAVKFTPDGGSVTLGAKRLGGLLEITVTDTGIGISAMDQAQLFQPFMQIDSSLTRKHQGTGLGLAMVMRLAELHGGTCGLHSETGKGSRFWVRIPWRQQESLNETGALQQAHPDHEPTAAANATPAGTTPLALVIEDNRHSATLLIGQLEAEGLRVVCVATGEEALVWLAHNTPNLITLDLLLPGMDGWELLTCIKEDARLNNVPVVIVSIVADFKRGMALGAHQVLQKPVSHADLSSALAACGLLPSQNKRAEHVLVIDDDPHSVDLISSYLKYDGYRVSAAYSGEKGMALAFSELPDLIVLDLMMPEISGFEVLTALKANPATAMIPVLIMTAKTITPEDRAKLNGQVQRILQKAEFHPDSFINEVRRVLYVGAHSRFGTGRSPVAEVIQDNA